MNNLSKYSEFFIFIIIISLFNACNKDDLSQLKSIQLRILTPKYQTVNKEFIFEIVGDNNSILTSDAEIKINGNSISGSSFTSAILGEFNVQATYKTFKSNIIEIKVVEVSYSQKVLVEDYTGTWCGHCPRVAWAIHLCEEQSDKIVSAAIHLANTSSDPFEFEGCITLKNEFSISGLPKAKINRINNWTYKEQEHLNDVLDRTGNNAPLGLALETTLNNNTIDANIKIGFDQTFSQNLNFVIYLVENGLIYNQTNYTDFYGGPGVISNFVHNNILRAIYTHHLGDAIPSGETVNGNIYTITISKPIPSSVEQINNLHLIAFVTNSVTNEVINVQEVKVGETVDFE